MKHWHQWITFPWRAGMLVVGAGRAAGETLRLCWDDALQEMLGHASEGYLGEIVDDNVYELINAARVVEADGPTKGALLEAAREKLGMPDLCILRERSGRWYPHDMGSDAPIHGHEFLKGVGGPTEFAAIWATWKAKP